MKTTTKLLLGIIVACGINLHGAEQELQKGVDFTGLTGFTPATLNQLVDNAVPGTNRGFVLIKGTTPDTATYPRFTNYLWLDISALPYTLKSYQTGSWVAATVGADAITTAMLQNGSVTGVKIASTTITTTNVANNAITDIKIQDGAITALKYANASITTGAISNNTISTALILDNAITTAKIQDAAVTGAKIASGAISNSHLAANSVFNTNLAVNAVANTNLQTGAVQATNITDGVISRAKLSFSLYTNNTPAAVSLPAQGATATIAHGLAGAPQITRVVMRCTSTDVGWASGDEVEVWAFTDNSAANETVFAVYVDATNVNILRDGDSATIRIGNKSTGVGASIDTTKWQLKAYCVYYP